jgi:diguanylate cyclase (GGDEF)-like protein
MHKELLRVLLIDDDEDDYLLTCGIFADGFGDRVSLDWAQTYATGFEMLTNGEYDVALVDYNLGSETGTDLLRAAFARDCRTPVIMLTGQTNRTTDLEAMHAGAADFLVKGSVTGDMLERSIRYACERHRLLEEIRSLSLIDELTGLGNRRAFFALAEPRLQLLERTGSLCMLVFADVDGLKMVNDTRGHEIGDALLIDAARVLRGAFRRSDIVARLGGDEFVVLADEVDEGDVEGVLVRLQTLIEARNAGIAAGQPQLSISTGVLSFRGAPPTTLPELLAEADGRMLQCKKVKRDWALTPVRAETVQVDPSLMADAFGAHARVGALALARSVLRRG